MIEFKFQAGGALPAMCTPDELASYVRLQTRTIYAAIQRGELAACRFGNRYRIASGDVERWLSDRQHVTATPRSPAAVARPARNKGRLRPLLEV